MKKRLTAAVLTLSLMLGICGQAAAKTEFSDGNRISRVTVREGSVQVEYRAEEAAELAAAFYTADEKELLASGRIRVPASTDGRAEIRLTGEIPDYAVVKTFLLTRREHAPLCPAYTTSGYTRKPEDVRDTEPGEFEQEQVLTVGEKDSFAVLKHGVVLVRTAGETSGTNRLVSRDDDAKVYRIQDAGEEIRNLHRGQILALETEPGCYLFVRVRKNVTEENTVTLYGDEDLRPGDVFDLMKLRVETGSAEEQKLSLMQDGLSGEAVVSFAGRFEGCGTEEQEFRLYTEINTSGTVTTDGAVDTEIRMDEISVSPAEGVVFQVAPRLHLRTEDAETVRWNIRQRVGFVYDSASNTFRKMETEAEPEPFLAADKPGTVALTVTAKPTVTLWEDTVRLWMELSWNGSSKMAEPDGQKELSGTLSAERQMEAGAVFMAEYGNPYSRGFLPEELPERTFFRTTENGVPDSGGE